MPKHLGHSDPITRSTMWPLLLEIEPRFQPFRNAFLAEWEPDGERLPEYICVWELVKFTIKAYERGEFSVVQRIMDIVDHWISKGDDDVIELAIVGFIEDLSNGNMHKETRPEDFERFMSQQMKAEWDNMIAAWEKFFRSSE